MGAEWLTKGLANTQDPQRWLTSAAWACQDMARRCAHVEEPYLERCWLLARGEVLRLCAQ